MKKILKLTQLLPLMALLSCLLSSYAVADDEKISISFNKINVNEVIRWAADLTDKTIIVSEQVANSNKPITVINSPNAPKLSKAEAYQAFLSILQANGMGVVETKQTLKIFIADQVKTMAVPTLNDGKAAPEDQIVISILKIKNISASQLVNLLNPLKPQSSQLMAHDDTNILLIADNKSNIDKIEKLVEQIDKVGNIDIQVIHLQYASAKEVASLLQSLVPKVIAAPGSPGAGAGAALSLAADERTNSILMNGDPVLRTQMEKLIDKLDQPLSGSGNTQVIYLNYADAKELEKILSSVGGSVASAEKDPKASSSTKDVSIVASDANNALIVTAPPSVLSTIKDVIQKLDIRRQQVLVEALLVEVNEDAGRQLGLFAQGDARNSGTELSGKFDPAGKLPSIPFDTGATVGSVNTGGLLAAYFREGNLRGVISVLGTMDSANILSTPTVIALDNENAEILVGQNVPFKTGVQNLGSTSTVGTSTTSLGSALTGANNAQMVNSNLFTQIQRQDVGIHLKVKPKINQNGTLTLEIDQTVENVVDSSVNSGASDIVTNKRQIKTKALVHDNEILTLGGLITDQTTNSESKVPFLGDIPVIGWLFKGSKKTSVKHNLMVFIHPKVLHTDEDGQKISNKNYNKMRGLQEKFNKNSDWLTLHSHSLPLLEEIPGTTPSDGSSAVKDDAVQLDKTK